MLKLSEYTEVPVALENIIQAMRAELEEYGAVLNLLDQQQMAILDREPERAGTLVRMMEEHLQKVSAYGTGRRNLVSRLTLDLPPEKTPVRMLALFPQPMRHLATALSEEIGRLSNLVTDRARQNRLLRARTPHGGTASRSRPAQAVSLAD